MILPATHSPSPVRPLQLLPLPGPFNLIPTVPHLPLAGTWCRFPRTPVVFKYMRAICQREPHKEPDRVRQVGMHGAYN